MLLSVTLVLMAFSSNSLVRDVQGGLGFAFRPITGALNDVARGVASIAEAAAEIDRLRIDNAALRIENERLLAERTLNEEIRRENEQLTALLQLRAGFEHQTVAVEVISRDSSEFRRVVGISKGSADGIEEGDVVIAAGGALVGRVSQVGLHAATVTLMTDPTSTVIGQLTTTAGIGQIRGQLDEVLVMGQIDSSEIIDLGVEVVTAGISLGEGVRSPYPKGLLIGQVIDVRRDANSVVQTAYVEPAASLDRLEWLLVIVDYEGGLPSLIDQPIDCGVVGVPGASDDPSTLPDGENPCLTPTPAPTPSTAPTPSGTSPAAS
jgi:rod shape-determining protein MreC